MEMDEALRREADRVPPVGLDEVLARAGTDRGRSRRHVGAMATVAVIVGILGVTGVALAFLPGDGGRGDETVAADDGGPGPSASSATSGAATAGVDGLVVQVVADGLGPMEASVGPIAESGDGTLQHDLRLTNPSDAPVYLADVRRSAGVGEPAALIVGTPGCGYSLDGTDGDVVAGACRSSYEPHVIAPGETLTLVMTVHRGLPGLAASFSSGTFTLPIEWRSDRPFVPFDDDSSAEAHAGSVELQYSHAD